MIEAYKCGMAFPVKLSPTRTDDISVTGTIGSGKTCGVASLIPTFIQNGNRELILDLTNSFDEEELEKAHFKVPTAGIKKLNVEEEPFVLGLSKKKVTNKQLADELADLVQESVNIKGDIQRQILKQGCLHCIESNKKLVQSISSYAEAVKDDENEKVNSKNAAKLIEHLRPLAEHNYFEIAPGHSSLDFTEQVMIVQLGDMDTENQAIVATAILMELWNLADEKSLGKYNVVIDEYQSLSLKKGSILADIIRKGRKRNLSVILATQYLTDRLAEEKTAIDQIETKLYFRPADREIKQIAECIDPYDTKTWEKILRNLEVGEAVLQGSYSIDKMVDNNPLLVKINL